MNSSNSKSKLFLFLFLLLILPAIIYLARQNQDVRKKAQVPKEEPKIQSPPKPEYKEREVIIKFKIQSAKFKTKTNINKSLDKEAVSFSELDDATIPQSLKTINQKYKIEKIEKVFKGAEEPQKELNKFRQKFSKEIAKGERKINEKELLKIDLSRTHKLTFNQNIPVEQVVKELSQDPEIEYAEPNYIFRTQLVPNDPYYLDHYPDNVSNRDPSWNPLYDYQWNLKKINMEQAWDITTGSNSVIVAVIDTGVDYTHPELGGCTLQQVNNNLCDKIAPGYDFVNSDNDPIDDHGHGTHVAGIIAASSNNSYGIAGISPDIKLLPLKVLDQNGSGTLENIIWAIYFTVNYNARVINASWSAYGYSQSLEEAIKYARSFELVFVAAAGNDRRNVQDFSPGNINCNSVDNPNEDCTITVSAVDKFDTFSKYSNWGTLIDVSAPGGGYYDNDILSLKSAVISNDLSSKIVGQNFLRLSGTSMAAPHVSALAALIISKQPTYSYHQVRNIILNGVDDLGIRSFDIYFGYGRINIAKSLSFMDTATPPIARISYPFLGLLTGKKFEIRGSAYGTGFSNYKIDYATSYEATQWSNVGIYLKNNGQASVLNGVLANVELPISNDGDYFIRLTSFTSDGRSAFMIIPIKFDSSIRDGFPVPYKAAIYEQNPVITDLNLDGIKEIIFYNQLENKLSVIDPNGKYLSGWPKSLDTINNYWNTYSSIVADIDPNYSGLEIVFPVVGMNAGLELLGFHYDGSEVANWTSLDWQNKSPLSSPNFGQTLSSGIINGKSVIILGENIKANLNLPLKLHVFNDQGQEVQGWPIVLDNENFSVNSLTPRVADIDSDGKIEIVIQYKQIIRIYSDNGTLQNEIQTSGEITNFVIADLDSDGLYEIIGSVYSNDDQRKIYVWRYNGEIYSDNWPFIVPSSDYNTPVRMLSVGDYNNDGYAEILTSDHGNGKFYLFDKNATLMSGFPYGIYQSQHNVANISLDNGAHLWSSDNFGEEVYLFSYNSTIGQVSIMPDYPKIINHSKEYLIYSTDVRSQYLLDLDNDNKIELIFPALLSDSISYLYVFNTPYSSNFLDWPQFLHDEFRTSAYTPKKVLITPSPITPTPTPIPSPTHCTPLGDIDCSGQVGILDLSTLLSNFGKKTGTAGFDPKTDLDNSGEITILDLSQLLGNFGRSSP